jgi:ribosomal protein S18 acetylase RimI-like enzyme
LAFDAMRHERLDIAISVREAEERDAAGLAVLFSDFSGLATSATQVEERLRRTRGIELCLVAEVDGRLVGFGCLRCVPCLGEDGPYAELSDLFVSVESRRLGIAEALVAALEARARAAGALGWSVIVDPKNEAARSLYQKLGFATFAVAQQKWFGDERPFRPPPAR